MAETTNASDDLRILLEPDNGFRGLWYANQPTQGPCTYKYSGGLGTYPQQHIPIAIYREDVNRTYFVYGTARQLPDPSEYGKGYEQPGDTTAAISYYDHATGQLARPMRLLQRNRNDSHENPVLCIDPDGYLLVFCPSHGNHRGAALLRSVQPHDISHFEMIHRWECGDSLSYPQPWWVDGVGLVLLHSRYENAKRRLAVCVSPDGVDWSCWDRPTWLSRLGCGSYQISWQRDDGLLATVFDLHPHCENDHPLNRRCNLYYAESADGGATWCTVDSQPLDLPLTDEDNPARLLDTQSQGRLVYIKDLCFDDAGQPVIVYITCTSAWPGETAGPHEWWLTHRDGHAWQHTRITESDHAYDHGSLARTADGGWRLLAPTQPGPVPYATGGQMRLWQSSDLTAWQQVRSVTDDPAHQHTYARRPVNAHPDFTWLWASAAADRPTSSCLYLADIDGTPRRMPQQVDEDFAEPSSEA